MTIDDSPSSHMTEKVIFLKSRQIPAIFFCRGEFFPKFRSHVVNAIKNGFLIGNHSYSHPYFSKISFAQCCDEILKTEQLIDSCYQEALTPRPLKVFRFPFGDRGADEMQPKLQQFLKNNGFTPFNFGLPTGEWIDAYWTWDSKDYKQKMKQDIDLYRKGLEEYWNESKKPIEVMILHDFEDNHHLFEAAMDFLIRKRACF